MNRSHIEWTESTWNPTTGCTKISSGCKNCYAERWANMQMKRGIKQYKKGFELTLAEERLEIPLKWKGEKIVFVNSMSDLFHDKVSDSYLKKVFEVMNSTTQHTYQILTKRIERLDHLSFDPIWSNNIWLGVSVENNECIGRIHKLKSSQAKLKFISFEPLLELINYDDLIDIDWVLVGGESGGKARKIEKDWVLTIKTNCSKTNTPFFFKQWGKRNFNPNHNDPTLNKNHAMFSKGGCMIDNEICREYPNIYKYGTTSKH